MCIGVPMQVVAALGDCRALCHRASYGRDSGGDGECREIDMQLVGSQPAGSWVLVFLDAAREVVSEQTARKTEMALQAIEQVSRGQQPDMELLFADLVDRDPVNPFLERKES